MYLLTSQKVTWPIYGRCGCWTKTIEQRRQGRSKNHPSKKYKRCTKNISREESQNFNWFYLFIIFVYIDHIFELLFFKDEARIILQKIYCKPGKVDFFVQKLIDRATNPTQFLIVPQCVLAFDVLFVFSEP